MNQTAAPSLIEQVIFHLEKVYPDIDHHTLATQLIEAFQLNGVAESLQQRQKKRQNHWDESDVLLITYGDSVRIPPGSANDPDIAQERPLQTLHQFWRSHLKTFINAVHILPFFPFSSDDGFSVMDYTLVNPSLGEWQDIQAFSKDVTLMSDLVINHASARRQWFKNYLKNHHPGADYFVEGDPQDDLSQVVRPRTSPLLKTVTTKQGTRHVWCTFGHDQVDLNFANPEVLLAFVRIIETYFQQGIRWLRLDAIAFLWKEVGTPCIHLPQTHEIVRLLRLLIEHRCPDAVIVTETNVPNDENLTYLGNANEAHMVYNFSLPPLLIHTLLSGNAHHIKSWLMSMPPPKLGTSYLNFIASHDGIGLRPTEQLLSDQERADIVTTLKTFGAKISSREVEPNVVKPYEINISLIDACKGTHKGQDQWQMARFICAHGVMLALEGIPAFYIHSLLGTENDNDKVKHTGHNRSINRHRWDYHQLLEALDDASSLSHQALVQLSVLTTLRKQQAAFHPNAPRTILHLEDHWLAFWRQALTPADQGTETRSDEPPIYQQIFAVFNMSDQEQRLSLADLNLDPNRPWQDLVSGVAVRDLLGTLSLPPYAFVWLSNL